MKSNYILWLFVIVFGLVSCKQEAGNVQQEQAQDPTKMTDAQEAQPQSGANAQDSPSAPAAQASTDGHDYTFLTDKLLLFKGSYGSKDTGEPLFKDEWIDFAPDGTFKAGKLKAQTHTGKWGYNHDMKILQLRPDVNTYKMSEWTVMYNEQMMVWVGTTTFGNNAIQVQLVRSDILP